MKFTLMTSVRQNPEDVMRGFSREFFESLTPPGVPLILERFDGLNVGDRIIVRIGFGAIEGRWVSLITENERTLSEIVYVDEGEELPAPLRYWRHRHRLLRRPGGGCLIRDEIQFRTGRLSLDLALFPVLYGQFAWRQPILRKAFGGL